MLQGVRGDRRHWPSLPPVNSFVEDSLRNTVPSVNEPLLQLVNAVFSM